MKKLLAVLALVFLGTVTFAQWQGTTPGNLYMNQGNCGIGFTNPADITMDLGVQDLTGPATFVLNTTVTPTGTGTYNLCQYDMRFNGATGEWYRNVLRKNMANGHTEMLQTLRNSAGAALAFLFVDLDSKNFEMKNGINDVAFNNVGTFAIGMGTYAVPAGAKVAVGGKVVAKEIEVTLTGMPPDFVFNKDYKLASLYDVENFINSNNHLPGVPSASEMTTKGVNVGDMNMTLLQKVEELTLYMIQLQKENDALKVRVNNLEK